ncbi:thermonuclease family protein [Rhizobium sp. TH2]|uniref:thermonuclease family protein n=1 Tax=Rhizobium sp. TH2 TaxID=2775403 RepID=UPI0021585E21|nr:thermonuclease family protein [Rhizobium sp. TH2]UVC08959.1 thermonuclease family protein [Rhizobium sp. TH2]
MQKPAADTVKFGSVLVVAFIIGSGKAEASSLRVIDGDTIQKNDVTIRLHGIDAPEAGQKCNGAGSKKWNCGQVAIAELESLVLAGAEPVCDDRGQDGYGRTIGVCKVGDVDINATMVMTGKAWAFRKYSTDYASIEDDAHAKRVGIWQADTQAPWDYRAEKWAGAEQESPNGCPIKGNISEKGHIYHAPWSPWYKRTKVNVAKGERWFCTEGEAVQAGWRAPQWGR